MRTPRHNVCDHCGRNAHKVAVKYPNTSSGRFPSGYRVVGYCPTCFADLLSPRSWHDDDFVPFANATLVYDLRAERTKAKAPVPEHMRP